MTGAPVSGGVHRSSMPPLRTVASRSVGAVFGLPLPGAEGVVRSTESLSGDEFSAASRARTVKL